MSGQVHADRRPLQARLEQARARRPDDAERIDRVLALVAAHPNCFERDCWAGHITASSWILSPRGDQFLLTHHRKLGRWLQLGGHADGDNQIVRVAVREAREESGMQHFEIAALGGEPLILDVDVHAIPARPGEPEHFHHDVRFLLRAVPGQSLTISEESNDLRWFPRAEASERCSEASLWRLAERANEWVESGGPWSPIDD